MAASSDIRAALDALRRIVQTLRLAERAVPGPATLTSAQLFTLRQIADHPGRSINEVAALTFTHQSSVSVVIQRLVDKRLVVKATARDDRRRQQLAITAGGRRALARAPAIVQERLIAAIATLPMRDRRALARSLETIAMHLRPGSAPRPPPMFFEDE